MDKYFYVYKWYNIDTGEIFYIGKGCKNRYKETKKRNQIFKQYYQNHNCTVEIVEYFDIEEEAFNKEKELISYYRNINQCIANLDDGGKGGQNFIWTEQMRQYKSQYNPMKDKKQKERMSKNNPMKNPKIVERVSQAHQKRIKIGNQEYPSLKAAAEQYKISPEAIGYWLKKGENPSKEKCIYIDPPNISNSRKPVPVIIDGNYYNSLRAGAKILDCAPNTLKKYLSQSSPCIYKNHKCEYANQQPSQMNTDKSSLEGSTTNE